MSHRFLLALSILLVAWILANTPTSSHLGRYGSIEKTQATGATATVYHYQLPNGTSYAVKRFRKKRAGVSDESYADSVKHEVAIAATLRHQHILEIVDFFSEDGVWYAIMPYVPTTLFDRTLGNDTILTNQEADCIFRQISDGVAYSHQQGIAHLDLKLNNILLKNGRDVKIIDFGQACSFRPTGVGGHVNRVRGRFGTPPNVPWEAYQDIDYDPAAADVWALGMIYCQMILPTAPWNLALHSSDEFALFSRSALAGAVPPQSQRVPERDKDHIQAAVEMIMQHLPNNSRSVISQMLQVEADRRISMDRALSDRWMEGLKNCERHV